MYGSLMIAQASKHVAIASREQHLKEFHVAGLALPKSVALLVAPRHCDKEEADADVLQLQPVKQRQCGACARPAESMRTFCAMCSS